MVEKIGPGLPPEANTQGLNGTANPEGNTEGVPATASYLSEADQTSENELVAFEDGGGDDSFAADDSGADRLSLIQQEYEMESENYRRYQNQLIELQKDKGEYERQIALHKDSPEVIKMYQRKLDSVDSQIGTLTDNISKCEGRMQELMTEYSNELTNTTLTASYGASGAADVSAGGAQAAGGETFTARSVVYGANAQSGSIPKDLANSLDRKLGSGFSAKCEQVAGYLGCNVNDLLAMMYSESGLQPTARNKSSNAIGLIQFMPSTLRGNGYSTEQVASMSAVQQLDVVADIFMKAKTMAGYGANEQIDGGTLYAINWLPAYAKRDTIATRGGSYYSSGLDMDKNGAVTKGDLTERLRRKYNEMLNNI